MAVSPSWLDSNFNLIQTAGILGSLWLGVAAACREARAREIQNLLTLSEHHRELWTTLSQRHELQRILETKVDLTAAPLTVAEEEFINLAMVLYRTTWSIAIAGGIITPRELAADIRGFFSLPLPRAVWEETKETRNPKFVRFVEKAMKDGRQRIPLASPYAR